MQMEASVPWAVAAELPFQQQPPRRLPSQHDLAGAALHACWTLANSRRHGVSTELCPPAMVSWEALELSVQHEPTLGAHRRRARRRIQACWTTHHPSARIPASPVGTVCVPLETPMLDDHGFQNLSLIAAMHRIIPVKNPSA